MTGRNEPQQIQPALEKRLEPRDLTALAQLLDAGGSALLECEASSHFSQPLLFAAAMALSARDTLIGMLPAGPARASPPGSAPGHLSPRGESADLIKSVLAVADHGRRYLATSPAAEADPAAVATVSAQLAEISSLLEQSGGR